MRVPSASSETQTDFYNVNRWRGRRETLGANRPASRRGRLRRNFPVAYFDVDIPNFFVTCPSVYAGGSVVALLRYGLVSIIPALPGQDRSSMLGVVVVRPAARAATNVSVRPRWTHFEKRRHGCTTLSAVLGIRAGAITPDGAP